ncbi:DegT/DnrJ/EryC1/StrS family aminotransferase [Desulfurivibrio sp. D14AmB]|uniref:DegT/DnrJ/EryC1/StrS family aminotransferase n=1 Tax=Desulfurivibrio sp. D14AmB TaxID=3374370 RepID=UPI00376EB5B4
MKGSKQIMAKVLPCTGEGAIFFGRRPEDLPALADDRQPVANHHAPYKFAYARTALKYGLQASGFTPGNVVLVPDLICESLLEPLADLGLGVCYYPVGPTLEPEWGQLEQLLADPVKALLVVHYFGQPQPMAEVLGFCRRNGLLLIEDNAHGFGATFEGQALGTFGEIGISSPRKSFPVPNGAFLYLAKDQMLDLAALRLTPTSASLRRRCRSWLQGLIPAALLRRRRATIAYRRRLGPPPPYGSQTAFREAPLAGDFVMAAGVDRFLNRQDVTKIGELRRRIYGIWLGWAKTRGLQPVFPELAAGAMPLVFPAYAKSVADSLQWYARGHWAGVDIHSWPTLPQAVVERNGGAMRLWERLVCFPIHQDMNIQVLERRLALL